MNSRWRSLNADLLCTSQSTLRAGFSLLVVLTCSSRGFVLSGTVSSQAVAGLFPFSVWDVGASFAFSIAVPLRERQIAGSLLFVCFSWWDGVALACSSREFALKGALLCLTRMCAE